MMQNRRRKKYLFRRPRRRCWRCDGTTASLHGAGRGCGRQRSGRWRRRRGGGSGSGGGHFSKRRRRDRWRRRRRRRRVSERRRRRKTTSSLLLSLPPSPDRASGHGSTPWPINDGDRDGSICRQHRGGACWASCFRWDRGNNSSACRGGSSKSRSNRSSSGS